MIELVNVSRTYMAGNVVMALRNANLSIPAGDFLGIVGASGSGKSTLLHLIGLLDKPSEGHIFFEGRDTALLSDRELSRLRGHAVGFVFQSFHLVPHLSVRENVELPLFYQGVPPRQRHLRSQAQLATVGLTARAHHVPAQLSGGERQRVAIARALITDPKLILADEPTGNLDSKTGAEILDILHRLHGQGKTILVITHDLAIAKRIPRVVQLADGVLTEGRAQ
jgi:ABC-type lipoprotein export system ATPase subunit